MTFPFGLKLFRHTLDGIERAETMGAPGPDKKVAALAHVEAALAAEPTPPIDLEATMRAVSQIIETVLLIVNLISKFRR